MLVTIIKRAEPSKIVILNAVDTMSDNGTNTTFTQDSTTYTFANASYKFITVNADD